mgnify:CR=1 FL=1
MTHGPLFLFDLAALYKNNQNMWPRDNTLIEKLGLIDTFEQCKRLIEITASEDDFSTQSMALINKIFKNFGRKFWMKNNKKIKNKYIKIFASILERLNQKASNFVVPRLFKNKNNLESSFNISSNIQSYCFFWKVIKSKKKEKRWRKQTCH